MTISKQIPLIGSSDAHVGAMRSFGGSLWTSSNAPGHLNGYFEVNTSAQDLSKRVSYNKRPGVNDLASVFTVYPTITNNSEKVWAVCTNLNKTAVLWASKDGTKVYSNFWDGTGGAPGTVTQTDVTASFPYASTPYFFITPFDGISYGSNVYYGVIAGAYGGLINASGVWSVITDADFTGNGVKTNFVGLNGYMFYGVISGTNAGRVYNSDVGAAAAASGWNSLSYVTPSDVPGNIVWLSRIRNLIVVFKQYSIEFLEDVGNPTPGSPLEPRKALTKRIGCASASSVKEVSDGIIFLGIDQQGKMGVWKISNVDLSLKKISDDNLEVILHSNFQPSTANFQQYSSDPLLSSNDARGQAQVIIWQNKEFYSIIINSANFTTSPTTFVYDNELGIWVSWNTSFVTSGTEDAWFYPSQSFMLFLGTGYCTVFVNNKHSTKARFCFLGNDKDLTPNYTMYTDQIDSSTSNNFTFAWASDLMDFGTFDRKRLHALEIIYNARAKNVSSSSSNVSGTFLLSLIKRDYYNSSSDISKTIADNAFARAKWNRLGAFRTVAFRISSNIPAPLKIWAIEVVYDNGPQYA